MDKQVFRLNGSAARQMASLAVARCEDGWICQISPPTRSSAANAKLHATFSEIAKVANFNGRRLTLEQWKVIFISAHAQATKEGADLVIGLEGEVVNIRESSAKMTVARMNSLIEYVQAWCVDRGVKLAADSGYEDMAR